MKKDKKRSHHFMAIPDACFEKRVHCVAFFSRQFRPSKNKTALTGSDALAEFQKIVNDDKLHIEYLRWLADCHRDYDDEVRAFLHSGLGIIAILSLWAEIQKKKTIRYNLEATHSSVLTTKPGREPGIGLSVLSSKKHSRVMTL
jgi:DNA-dependent RNA polymerase auxiliary subunit epsilon